MRGIECGTVASAADRAAVDERAPNALIRRLRVSDISSEYPAGRCPLSPVSRRRTMQTFSQGLPEVSLAQASSATCWEVRDYVARDIARQGSRPAPSHAVETSERHLAEVCGTELAALRDDPVEAVIVDAEIGPCSEA
jgi:hypothetical protein